MIERFQARIRAAAESGQPLRIRGGGTKDFYGNPSEGELLDTREYAGIVDYEPTELVITAHGGTPLGEVEAVLAQRGQMLAFEPPHFGPGATIGGCVAAGLSGPRRAQAGAVRDFVLGAEVMDGRGELLAFGGQVMKNVAGYDVARLMAGSLGTLGLIVEVSLKVLPRPFGEETLRLELPEDRAIAVMNRWGEQPLPISATCWCAGELTVRLSGAEAAVRAARSRIGGAAVAQPKAFWEGVREQTDPFFSGEGTLWRVSLPSTAARLELPGVQLIEWGGSLRWLRSPADPAVIREAVQAAGGHATLFRAAEKHAPAFPPLAPALLKVHRRLKQAFDPKGILNRGRLYDY